MKMGVNGTFHNIEAGVVVGQVVDIEDAEAERYIALGYAEAVKPGRLSEEHAVAALSNEERAVLSTEIVGASSKPIPQPRAPRPPQVELPKSNPELPNKAKSEPKAESEPKPKPEPPVKRAPGRPARKPR